MLLVTLAVPGCAIFDPYVMPPKLQASQAETTRDSKPGQPAAGREADLPNAREDAYKYARQLAQAASGHSQLRSATALMLVPMTAVAAYKGVVSSGDGTNKLITKLVLGSAALFGLGEYFYSAPRQAVYFEGMLTTLCLVGTTDPYLFTRREYDQFAGDLGALARAISSSRSQIESAKRQLASIPGEAQFKAQARAYMGSATRTLRDAESTQEAGLVFKSRIDRAGADLERRVAAVAVKVAIETGKTEPDLASLKPMLASISGAVVTSPTAPATSAPSAPDPTKIIHDSKGSIEASALKGELDALEQSLKALAVAAAPVAEVVNVGAINVKAAGNANECTLASPASTFRVEPAGPRVHVAVPSKTTFVVTGGNGAVRATVAGNSQGDKIVATPALKDGFYTVVVDVKEGAAAGSPRLVLSDNAPANMKSIELVIPEADAPATPPAPNTPGTPATPDTPTPSPAATPPADEVTSPDEVKAIQKALGVTVDGIAGAQTRKAAEAFKTKNNFRKPNGSLTRELLARLPVVPQTAAGEQVLSPGDIADIQKALKKGGFLEQNAARETRLDAPGIVAAIRAYQKSRSESQTGVPTFAQVRDLLGL